MIRHWGWHLSVDASLCDHEKITSYENIYAFTKELVKNIDMIAYGEPEIVHFGTGNKAGFTMSQLIETSNICAHFVNEYNAMFLDVFSCKDFDTSVVVNTVTKYFNPKTILTNRKDRSCWFA